MGTFHATVEVGDPDGQRYETVEAMVDTGATYTWIPSDVLARLGVAPQYKRQLMTADGRVIERDAAQTWVRYDGSAHITFIIFGDEGSTPLLGAYTLEGFGLAADPLGKRLIPVPGYALGIVGVSDPSRELALRHGNRETRMRGPHSRRDRAEALSYDPALSKLRDSSRRREDGEEPPERRSCRAKALPQADAKVRCYDKTQQQNTTSTESARRRKEPWLK